MQPSLTSRLAMPGLTPLSAALLLALASLSSAAPLLAQTTTAGEGNPAASAAAQDNWLSGQIRQFRSYPLADRAYRLLEQGRVEEAAEQLRAGLAVAPQDAALRQTYLHVLYRLRRHTELQAQAERLVAQAPGNMSALLFLGLAQQGLGQHAAALSSFAKVYASERATRQDREFAAASAAEAALARKQYPQAIAALDSLRQFRNAYDVNHRRGTVLDAMGRSAQARAAYQEALGQAADGASRERTLAALGYLEIRDGNRGAAIAYGERILQTSPDNVEWLRTLTDLQYQEQNLAAAEAAARRAVAVTGAAQDRLLVANVLMGRRDYRGALAEYEQSLPGLGDPALRYQAAMGLGYAHDALRNAAGAREAFALANSIRPSPEAASAYAAAAAGAAASSGVSGDGAAGSSASGGGDIAPDSSTLSARYAAQGRTGQAIAVLERAVRAGGDDALRLQLAEIHAAQGDGPAAMKAIAGFKPATPEQRRRLAYVLGAAGERSRAIALLAPVAATPAHLLQLSQYHAAEGQTVEALAVLDKLLARRLEPQFRLQALRQSGYLLARSGQSEQALARFKEAIAAGGDDDATRLETAFLLAAGQRHDEALEQLLQVYGRQRSAPVALHIARAHAALARPQEAVDYYLAALENENGLSAEDRAAALVETGQVYADLGDFQKAYRQWLAAAERGGPAGLQLQLALAEEKLIRTEDALRRLRGLPVASLPRAQQLQYHDQLGRLHAAAGNAAEAARALDQALALEPSPARHYQRGLAALQGEDPGTARTHLEHAARADADNVEYQLQLAYLCKRERDTRCAAQAFERAAALDPSRKAVHAELGYTYMQGHNNKQAVEWFKRAIDAELAQPQAEAAAKSSTPLTTHFLPVAAVQPEVQRAGAREQDAERVHRLRQQVRDMTRQYQFNLYQSYRSDNGRRTSDVAPGFQTGGLIPSQGGVEFLYQPPELGYRDGKTFRLFARTLWSNRPDSLSIDSDTLQGGVGIEYKPLAAQNVYVSLERLVKIGDQAQNNWLARVSWGYSDGYDMQFGKQSWNQTLAYADAGYLLQGANTRSVYGEIRQGRSFRLQDRWMATPHVVAAGRAQRPDPSDISYLEFGAGVSFRYVFNETRYQAPRSSAEFGVQYRKAVTNDRAGGWLLTSALQF